MKALMGMFMEFVGMFSDGDSASAAETAGPSQPDHPRYPAYYDRGWEAEEDVAATAAAAGVGDWERQADTYTSMDLKGSLDPPTFEFVDDDDEGDDAEDGGGDDEERRARKAAKKREKKQRRKERAKR